MIAVQWNKRLYDGRNHRALIIGTLAISFFHWLPRFGRVVPMPVKYAIIKQGPIVGINRYGFVKKEN